MSRESGAPGDDDNGEDSTLPKDHNVPSTNAMGYTQSVWNAESRRTRIWAIVFLGFTILLGIIDSLFGIP